VGGTVPVVTGARIMEEMKRDAFGVVERIACEGPDGAPVELVRRIVVGPALLRPLARLLARREQRALETLRTSGITAIAATPRVPPALLAELSSMPTLSGESPRGRDVFLRPFAQGQPLHLTGELPRDFFDLLEGSVRALHGAGVCHNDLHKEQNIVVDPAGRPVLIDFQLASVHPRRTGRTFVARCRDDLRHIQKLRRRYTRDGRGPEELRVPDEARMQRRGLALLWRRTVKPLYLFVTRRVLRTRDGEVGRPSAGPWPRWTEPVGALQENARDA